MAQNKNILQTPNPGLSNFRPEFYKDEFEKAIFAKGYDVTLETALRCPCHGRDAALPDCQNCFGTGYFYVNPTKTKALITGINQNNQYKNWTEALLGTFAVTVIDKDKPNLGYFNRITFETEYSYFSENLEIREMNGEFFVFTTYRVIDLISLHTFISSTEKLSKTNQAHINPENPYCLILDFEPPMNGVVSVYYKHRVEGHILDIVHEVRASWETSKIKGSLQKIQLPVQAIVRRSHLIAIEKPNFDGSGVIINDNI